VNVWDDDATLSTDAEAAMDGESDGNGLRKEDAIDTARIED